MSIVFNNNENILHAYTQSQVLFSRHNDTPKGVKWAKEQVNQWADHQKVWLCLNSI